VPRPAAGCIGLPLIVPAAATVSVGNPQRRQSRGMASLTLMVGTLGSPNDFRSAQICGHHSSAGTRLHYDRGLMGIASGRRKQHVIKITASAQYQGQMSLSRHSSLLDEHPWRGVTAIWARRCMRQSHPSFRAPCEVFHNFISNLFSCSWV
jgi:hypothetical protein